ncbi:MAG: Rieske 2Fe-2S domain-containing protein [Acidimicrobiales bacterium]
MIPVTGRILLCRRANLGPGLLHRFDVDGRLIVVVALGDELIALDDTCSHEDASLAEDGEIDADAREIECCRHGARFSLDDGSVASLPAISPLRTYRVIADGDRVFIEIPS